MFLSLMAGAPAGAQQPEDLFRIPPAFRSWIDPTGTLGHLGAPRPISTQLALALPAAPLLSLAPERSWLRRWGPTLLTAAALGILEVAVDPPADPRWSSKNSLDTSVRDALVGGSRSTRGRASTASDYLYGAMGLALAADWVWLRDEYGAWESAQRELPWLLGSAVSSRVLKLSTGRQRPYVDPCSVDAKYISGCDPGRDDNTSFYSGHATTSATFAGLLCARHLHRMERTGVDLAVCGGAVAGTVTTGILRMTADEHWFTDVLAGWATGALFGYVLPVHFQFGKDEDTNGVPPALGFHGFMPVVGTRFFGLRYETRF